MKPAKLHLLALLGAALLAALPPVARAADNNPPTQLTYQGFLTDPNGLPLGNTAPVNKTVQFRIFAAESGGTALWASSQVVTVDKGHFSVLLGQGSAVGSEPFLADLTTLFTGTGASDRYVELNVDGAALAPRLRFLPAPYAMLARKAMSVDSTATLLPAQVSGTFVAGQIPNLDASKITTGTLPNERTTATSANTSNAIVARDASGNIAINAATAGTLDFGSALGGKISLWGGFGAGGYFGAGIQTSLLQIHVNNGSSDIAFGHGSSANLTELMRIKGNGNVGIGTTAPGKKLDVNGNARIGGHLIFNQNDGVINWGRTGTLFFRGNPTTGDESTFAERMVLTGEGRLGIGTISPAGPLDVYSGTTQAFLVSTKGYVGIGTTTPLAPLHVVKSGYTWTDVLGTDHKTGNVNGTEPNFGIYLGADAAGVGVGGDNASYGDNVTIANRTIAAIFDGMTICRDRMYVGNVAFSSDLRAKNVLGLSKSEEDLATLLNLRITDYNWIDRSKDGHRKHKQLIAQDVEMVFPQAISISPSPEAIPNVYEVAAALEYDAQAKSLRVTTKKVHEFKTGDKVDVMMDSTPMTTVEVKAVLTPHQFVVAAEKPAKKVFVYGKQVHDFRTVDYTAISMLNVSATQELARQNEALKKRVSELESRERQVVTLQKRVTELEGLERQVAELQKLVRQVAERQSPSPRAALSENGAVAVLPVSAR
jgi:hypothetical protein